MRKDQTNDKLLNVTMERMVNADVCKAEWGGDVSDVTFQLDVIIIDGCGLRIVGTGEPAPRRRRCRCDGRAAAMALTLQSWRERRRRAVSPLCNWRSKCMSWTICVGFFFRYIQCALAPVLSSVSKNCECSAQQTNNRSELGLVSPVESRCSDVSSYPVHCY